MGLYNVLFGTNPLAPVLLAVLGLRPVWEDVGRFRDVWITEEGRIVILTRNGAGNRECWEFEGCNPTSRDPKDHDPRCLVRINWNLTRHPNYVRDYDDQYDPTYAYFEFYVPERYRDLTKSLLEAQSGEYRRSLEERFKGTVKEIMEMDEKKFKEKYPDLYKIMEILRELAKR